MLFKLSEIKKRNKSKGKKSLIIKSSKIERFFRNKKKMNLKVIFIEIPLLNSLFLSASNPETTQPEELMVLQEKKNQKNLNLNLGENLLFFLVFIISLLKKKKISRAKILFFSQLKLFFKFPKIYNNLGKITYLVLRIINIQFQSFFFFFLLLLSKEKRERDIIYTSFSGDSFPFFDFFQKFLHGSLSLFLNFAKKTDKQSFGCRIKFLNSIERDLRNRDFRKFYLNGFIFLSFFFDSERIPRNLVSFFSKFGDLKSNSVHISNSFLFLVYPEFYYKSLAETIQKKAISNFLFCEEKDKINFLKQDSPEFSRKNRIERIRDFQTLRMFQKMTLYSFGDKKREKLFTSRKKKHRSIFPNQSFSFFSLRILLAIKLEF